MSGVSKKAGGSNTKSAGCKAQEEKDALTIYIRNVGEHITYEMLYKAFSAFGTIRTLNVLHPKACAFAEFATHEAYQKALAAGCVPVGDGQETVLPEKRVRRPQQTFAGRPSRDNLKSVGNRLVPIVPSHHLYLSSDNSSTTSTNSSDSARNDGMTKGQSTYENQIKVSSNWLRREDEGCDLTTAY
ncbi:hypothetical protein BC939DRAFT_141191 [Gamsiella multidivaricata]|uniref:uncharacterized protein n=1 Tax=Gamsiella multidivaricata TaxID=101098 RepID=UPI00221FA37E|nr:uncharacterized protein BC939DRAFT_141191 [Gamsiella multidivaricata]KAI7824297.1 hypothetical protein BC939DRAFT_141191 [Gamsiella multidivaricata]